MAGRTRPEDRRHRYTRDEDWQALTYAWKKSPLLPQLFNDAFTVYEMTARAEQRIEDTDDGTALIKETWAILRTLGITIDIPPRGQSGRRGGPVHFTLPMDLPRIP